MDDLLWKKQSNVDIFYMNIPQGIIFNILMILMGKFDYKYVKC